MNRFLHCYYYWPYSFVQKYCVVYRTIANERDSVYLQVYSNLITSWCADSEKFLDVKQCVNGTFTRKPSFQLNTYTVNYAAVTTAEEYKYLGVYLGSG